MKSITILLTTRNNEETIEQCVRSLLNQSYKNYKIHITEAYSTDKTYEILTRLKKKYHNKIILERIKGNMSVAYNHMVSRAKSDYIAFIDGDAVADKNWLKILIDSFEPNVVAVGGMIKNPKGLNHLQKVIGLELEKRFERMPKYVSRLPTMNLMVLSKFAKKNLFDSGLNVVQETSWGYQLNKFGKIRFVKNAIVYHYHRATLKGYVRQQYLYGKNVPKVYLNRKNISKIGGDEVSGTNIVYDIVILGLFGVFGTASYLLSSIFLLVFSKILFIFLFLSYVIKSMHVSLSLFDMMLMIGILFIRNVAWDIGVLIGIIEMVIR